jgi:hypothetical protein
VVAVPRQNGDAVACSDAVIEKRIGQTRNVQIKLGIAPSARTEAQGFFLWDPACRPT